MVLAFCRRDSVIPLCRYLLVGRDMKEGISGLTNESSKTKRAEVFQRMTAASPLTLPFLSHKVYYSTFLLNLSLFWHINQGIEGIMADHVHHEMTRNLIVVYLKVFLLIGIKDIVLFVLFFMNNSKNLMDRTHPSLLLSFRPLHLRRGSLLALELGSFFFLPSPISYRKGRILKSS